MALGKLAMRRILWVLIVVMIVPSIWAIKRLGSMDKPDSLQERLGDYQKVTQRDRLAAVGRLSEIASRDRHFFSEPGDYSPLKTPGPSDWLTHHSESGQTFRQFTEGKPNYPNSGQHKIVLLPLGEFPENEQAELELLRQFTAKFFMMETVWLSPLAIDETKMPFKVSESRRRQLYTEDAIEELIKHLPDDAYCMLAVTMEDLVPRGNWNYVFGQASFRERVGVFSFARFDPKFFGEELVAGPIIARRRCLVLAHEIGHMFGIKHCIYYDCLMNGSNSLAESDAGPLNLCPVCLRKLHHSVGFDLADREREIAEVLRDQGLTDDADWYRRRLARITTD